MAKRKEIKKIIVEERFHKEELPPNCLGNKEEYCSREYCGEWFDKCSVRVEEEIHQEAVDEND